MTVQCKTNNFINKNVYFNNNVIALYVAIWRNRTRHIVVDAFSIDNEKFVKLFYNGLNKPLLRNLIYKKFNTEDLRWTLKQK